MPRRQLKGIKPRHKKSVHKVHIFKWVLIAFFIFVIYYSYKEFYNNIMPIFFTMADYKAQSIATDVINKSVSEVINEKQIKSSDLVQYHYDQEGHVNDCIVDTMAINTLCADVIDRMTKRFDELGATKVNVPLGNVTGNDLLANLGPVMQIKITPMGTSVIDYEREFKSTGINQINHRIWLKITTKVQIVVPMATKEVNISQKLTLIDRTFTGEVPPNYVNVPETNVLDVAPGEFNKGGN